MGSLKCLPISCRHSDFTVRRIRISRFVIIRISCCRMKLMCTLKIFHGASQVFLSAADLRCAFMSYHAIFVLKFQGIGIDLEEIASE
ncbi:hypothetical protein TSUD_112290 [Trifolium subterraneum]|uniref:Uncharacterized protein n=1 Tax=Trifolium subterraneum TaxID=3900 RepID=A0A2Z6P947_TRISU|nr:hypothetical protein TSUD_112290 [Trifolium subterraneum]